jgi:2-iminoacetate synthase
MSTFLDVFKKCDWDFTHRQIYSTTPEQVMAVLEKAHASIALDLNDFSVLISPAAAQFLEPMAVLSQERTQKRWGNIIQMYDPMYLSNECHNTCTYCGFSFENKITRKTLNDDEIHQEAKALKALGIDHVLIVTGEANSTVGVDYLVNAITILRPYFSNISAEVQPLEQNEYEQLIAAGLSSVLVYQETYHEAEYKTHHPKGKKSLFNYRLETPDRLGRAQIKKIGLGALFGLEDWRVDSFYTALHLQYLEKNYWQTRYSVSFPRLRPHVGSVQPKVEMTDRDLVQLICAWRILNSELELSMSTRESPKFRNNIVKFGINSMSAGARTNPGGYSLGREESLEQFEISDGRSPLEISQMLTEQGYQPVWKDWDPSFDSQR